MPRTIAPANPYRVSRLHSLGPKDIGLGLLAAGLYVLSFPNFNLSLLAWVALVPIAYVSVEVTPRRAFQVGWLAGTVAYCGILYWIVVTFLAARQSILLASLCLVLLAAYLGLFWGAWAWWVSITSGREYPGNAPPSIAIWPAAAGWVALEFLRTHLFSGFPWALLGDSQWRHLYMIQIASITGVYGVSFLVVLVNMANAHGLRRSTRAALSAAVLVAVCVFYSASRLRSYAHEPSAELHKVALLQGNVDQYQKWDKRYVQGIEKMYSELSSLAALEKPALMIWPETSVPGFLLQEPPLRAWLTSVVRRTGTTHLIGAPSQESGGLAYNAAFVLNAEGEILGEYAKQHLVPFGEVVPLARVLGRWIRVLNDLGGFTAGRRSPVLVTPIGPIGVNICYEAIFPDLVRRSAKQGAGLIVNLTNDGWYMRTAAPYQHFVPNVFRAIENDRWVLRADNTGVSAIIDPTGRVQASTAIFVPTMITGMAGLRSTQTFYTHYGDLFAWLCLVFCITVWLRGILRRP